LGTRLHFGEDRYLDLSVFGISYVLIWRTHNSEKFLLGKTQLVLKELLEESALSMGVKIQDSIISDCRVVLLVDALPTHSPAQIVRDLKEYTDRALEIMPSGIAGKGRTTWSSTCIIESCDSSAKEIRVPLGYEEHKEDRMAEEYERAKYIEEAKKAEEAERAKYEAERAKYIEEAKKATEAQGVEKVKRLRIMKRLK